MTIQHTALDQVRSLIERLTPEAICDDYVADRLKLTFRQHANHKSQELAGILGLNEDW